MRDSNPSNPIAAASLKEILGDGEELALVDVREELIFSRNHLLWARSVPLSRLELRFAQLVPRRTTRIVLCDDNDGLAQRAADILAHAGYSDVAHLDGGVAAWADADFELFSGMHVPSKAFGEFIEHETKTPSISADELHRLQQNGAKLAVLDSRPFDEYTRISIPGGINVPGAELVLRVHDIAPSPDTLVVVNCAGRTRSIIGAQSLINAGVPNKVVALRNGTMGWHLAGLKVDKGKSVRAPDVTDKGGAWAKAKTDAIARRFGIEKIDRDMLDRWRGDKSRTLYIFDVRDPSEYEAGHVPGAISAPGGQLVQATDIYAGTLGARVVLCDEKEVRAVMTASWLKQMGWNDVVVLAERGTETGFPPADIIGTPSPASIDSSALTTSLARGQVTVLDLSRSPEYHKGHIPGAWFAIRSRLKEALAKVPAPRELVLTSEDGTLASLAVNDAQALAKCPVRWLKGGNAAWSAAGHPLSQEPRMADEPIDVWLKPYERPGEQKDAMNEYLSWEVDLLTRIERDGTCNFTTRPF
ncbi:MAG TPA: rhodanese-like domain-containing protein [Pseudolabrys sp.]|nr:rhodanese-like domain-containing protein [Pseudolabrys sp.]